MVYIEMILFSYSDSQGWLWFLWSKYSLYQPITSIILTLESAMQRCSFSPSCHTKAQGGLLSGNMGAGNRRRFLCYSAVVFLAASGSLDVFIGSEPDSLALVILCASQYHFFFLLWFIPCGTPFLLSLLPSTSALLCVVLRLGPGVSWMLGQHCNYWPITTGHGVSFSCLLLATLTQADAQCPS